MNKEEMDVLWQQAQETSVKKNLHTARYDFANLILEAAAAVECDSLEYVFKPGHECAESIRSMKV